MKSQTNFDSHIAKVNYMVYVPGKVKFKLRLRNISVKRKNIHSISVTTQT